MSDSKQTARIAILGAGEVGTTIAFGLICNNVAPEILIVDPQEEMRDAQVQDLSDATFHGDTRTIVRAGTHKDAGQSDIVVVTAGAKQKKGESRTDLIGRNLSILKSAITDMKPFRKDTILLIVANPVDVLTYYAQKFSELPQAQVFGSGTFLDSARLRGTLAEKAGIAASSVEAFVLGEHGESQMVAWSSASISGVPLTNIISSSELDKKAIAESTKTKASTIQEHKGSTAFGIGGVASSICKSILSDQRIVRPVSFYQEDMKVCLSMPAVLGRGGLVRTVPIDLSEGERGELEKSAESLREVIEEAEKSEDSS